MNGHKKAPVAPTTRAHEAERKSSRKNVMTNSIAVTEEHNAQQTARVYQFKQSSEVRVWLIDGEPWFYAVDVCASIALTDTNKALLGLDDDEKCEHEQYSGSGRKPILINESGLYSLILRSRKPEAKAFKKWVTSEVLPSIRKTGAYIHAPAMRPKLSKEHAAKMQNLAWRMTSGWALGEHAKDWIYNHLRVVFQVAKIQDLPDDQFDNIMSLLWSKEASVSSFNCFMMEARSYFEKEVLGGGQPWTPTIKSKLSRQLKREVILPPIVDWLALAKQVSPVVGKRSAA
jgi:prophage antirepressor-like protein